MLGSERLGTGVAVDTDRILTAHYLVLGAERVSVSGPDGRTRTVERVGIDHESGLALLVTSGAPLLPVAAADGGPRPGTPVFLLSCADERQHRGATGHVTAVAPFEAFWEYMLDRAIMTTVINPGLAGAGLFDAEARLMGIVSLGLAAVGRYSLAIPVELYRRQRDVLEAEPDSRRGHRAWIGFYPQAFDGGIVVTGVVSGGPADEAGLTRGDVVLAVDGEPVSTLRGLYDQLWTHRPGEVVAVRVLRDSTVVDVEVTARDRYDFYR